MGGIYWLASYPKSGNTWFRAFLANLRDERDTPADINALETGSIASARGWLDDVLGIPTVELLDDEVDRLRPAVYRWSSRFDEVEYHKVHDAYTDGPDGEPVLGGEGILGAVYILRNPLDVALSAASFFGKPVDWSIEFLSRSGAALGGQPGLHQDQTRQHLLSWSEHVVGWVDAPGLRVHVVRYEDMLARPLETFGAAARFLGLPCDDDRVEKAIRFSSFDELRRQEGERGFKERPQNADAFFRKGRSGGWREKLSPGQVERIVADHGPVMRRFGYLSADGAPA